MTVAKGTTKGMPTAEQVAANEREVWESAGGWRPQAGDVVTGKVTDITTGSSEFGRYPIVTLTTKDGNEVAVHAFHHTLKNRLREMRPKLGNTLTIQYHGMVDQVDGDGNPRMVDGEVRQLAQYTAESPEFEFNWDAF